MFALGDGFLTGRQLLHLPVEMSPMTGHKDNHASTGQERKSCIDEQKLCISIDMHGVIRVDLDQVSLHSSRGIENDHVQVICPLLQVMKKLLDIARACHITGQGETTHSALRHCCNHLVCSCRFVAVGKSHIITVICQCQRSPSSNTA